MTGVLALLQRWLAAVEQAGARVPAAAAAVGSSSWPLAALAAVLGIALLVAGVRLGRLLSATGGGLVGWLAATALGPIGVGSLPPSAAGWAAAAVLGLASGFAPELYPLALGVVPGAMIGLQVPLGGRPWVGAAVGGALCALVLVAVRRLVLAGTAAAIGAALVGASMLALSGHFPALAAVAQRPLLLVGVCAVLAVAGTAYQIDGQARTGRAGAGSGARPLPLE